MRSNPLIRAVTKNRKQNPPPPILHEKGGATISSVHGGAVGDIRSQDQLAKSYQQDGMQKVAFAMPAATKEKTHWELYNDLALIYDHEMIKEWDDSLSLILVFGALFSGVITAFIMSSITLLTPDIDPPEINVILQTISHQLRNLSTEPYTYEEKPSPHARSWTVQVNALFFTSLGCTILASLAAVLCLQWIRDFDKGLASMTNPTERALKRQFRLEGIKKWHLPTIIGVLPTLLVIALILFMAGVVVWLRGISLTVTIISCTVLILGGGFYVATAILAAIFPSAPFNSSASRLVEVLLFVIYRSFQTAQRRYLAYKASNDGWESIPSVAPDTTAFFGGHRHREDEAIKLDSKLTSVSLLWLLSHIEVTPGSVQRLEDILHRVLYVDSPKSMLQLYEAYRVPWSRILAFLADQIDLVELVQPSFRPKTLAKLELLAQVSGVIGIQSYSDTLRNLFWSPPTRLPDFQSSPTGIYWRFVLWRWGMPIFEDQTAPLQLFKDLAKVSGRSSPAFTLAWLSELRSLLVQRQTLDRESVLEVLIDLCASQASGPLPIFTQEITSVYYADVLSHVIITTIVVLNPAIGRRNLSRADAQPLDQLVDTLALWYESTKAKGGEQELKGIDSLMKYLIHGLLLELSNESMDVQLHAMRQLRRGWIRGLVQLNPEPLYGIEVKPDSHSTEHYHPYALNGLRTLEKGTICWSDEVANLLFGYLRTTKKTTPYTLRDQYFTIEVLFTVAFLTSKDLVKKEESGEQAMIAQFWNEGDSVASILGALIALSTVMEADSSAVLTSAGIGSYVLPILGRWLEREQTDELVDKVSQIEDRTLRWYAYQLLGWEYQDVLPGLRDDTLWECLEWRQALFEWSMLPLRPRSSDNTTLMMLAQRANREHDPIILNYFSARLSEQKPEDTEYGRDKPSSCKQLLMAALSVFPLVPHLTASSLGFMNRILDYQDGMRDFINYGGLDWLAALPQVMASTINQQEDDEDVEEIATDSTKAPTITTDSFYVLWTWFDKGFLNSLNDQYLSAILRSNLVSTYPDDREPRWFLGVVVRLLNQLSSLPNASGKAPVVFLEAAECCTRILNHQISTATALQESSKRSSLLPGDRSWLIPAHGDAFIPADFQAWQLFVRGLIRTLRGEKGLSYPSTPEE